jgi:Tol biopolymer transport system component
MKALLHWTLILWGVCTLLIGGVLVMQRRAPSPAFLILNRQYDTSYRSIYYTMLPDGSAHHRIPNLPSENVSIEWAQHTPRLQYRLNYRNTYYHISPDGGNQQLIATSVATLASRSGENLVYAPDKRRLVFAQRQEEGNELFLIHFGEGHTFHSQPIAKVPGEVYSLFWSPDMAWIYTYTCLRDEVTCSLYRLTSQGQDLTELATFSYDYNPDWLWSPDGSQLMMLWRHEDLDYLYRLTPDGSTVENLGKNILPLWWSPDGRELVVGMHHRQENLFGRFRMRPDGSGLTRLTDSILIGNVYPSPDNRWLYFTDSPENNFDEVGLYRVPTDHLTAETVERIIDRVSPYQPILWAGDKMVILLPITSTSHSGLYLVSQDGSQRSKLAELNDSQAQAYFQLSPDGAWVYYMQASRSNDFSGMQNIRVRLDGSGAQELPHSDNFIPAFSPLVDMPFQPWVIGLGGIALCLVAGRGRLYRITTRKR